MSQNCSNWPVSKDINKIYTDTKSKNSVVIADGKQFVAKNIDVISMPSCAGYYQDDIIKEISIEIPLIINAKKENYIISDDTLNYNVYFNEVYSKLKYTNINISSITIVTNIKTYVRSTDIMVIIIKSLLNNINKDIISEISPEFIENNIYESNIVSIDI